MRLIMADIPPEDAFVVQLACESLHILIRERFERSGGVQTALSGVLSSVVRFAWVRGWPEEEESQPRWLMWWDRRTCSTIARGGGLEVLKHVRDQGCEWSEETCSAAAQGGHLEILKWARANGCDWTQDVCLSVAWGFGHAMVAAWIQAN